MKHPYPSPTDVGMQTARLFLHIMDGDRLFRDPDGSFFHDLETARSEAVECARELMAAGIMDEGRIGIERSMVICDANGTTLLVLPFREAVVLSETGTGLG